MTGPADSVRHIKAPHCPDGLFTRTPFFFREPFNRFNRSPRPPNRVGSVMQSLCNNLLAILSS